MSDDRCECCDLPAYSCGRAVEARQRADEIARRKRLLSLPHTFGAMYPGICGICGERFAEGDPITRVEAESSWNAWRALLCCATDFEAATR